MLKSNVTIEKVEEISTESGCGCGGSCACGSHADAKVEQIEIVASESSCGCGNGDC